MYSTTTSQAAVLALRQLQDQLATAYAENARLQEDKAAQIHRLDAELQDSRCSLSHMDSQLQEMHELLQVPVQPVYVTDSWLLCVTLHNSF